MRRTGCSGDAAHRLIDSWNTHPQIQTNNQIQSSWLRRDSPIIYYSFSSRGGLLSPAQTHCLRKVRLCVFVLSLTFFEPFIYLFWWRSDLHAATLVQTASTKQYDLSPPPQNNQNLTRCEMSFLAVPSSFPAIFFMQSFKMNEWMGVSLTIYGQIWVWREDRKRCSAFLVGCDL